MTQRLPPLVWLKAFEAAGRLQSFRLAAQELNVTPSAVSHHVKSLEQRLGRPLFQRSGNSVRLTREGGDYLEMISAAFAQLKSAGEVFQRSGTGKRLTIGAFPFLVSEVLVPGLEELRDSLPRVAISVVSGTQLDLLSHVDPSQRVDAIIRYGNGRFPACSARRLTGIELVPIAAPALRAARADAVEIIASGPRIAVAGPFDGWSRWSSATGISLAADSDVLTFDSYLSAMRATEQGLGVGLGIRPFIQPWLASGRIEILLEQPAAAGQASYLVTAPFAGARPELEILESWLLRRFVDHADQPVKQIHPTL